MNGWTIEELRQFENLTDVKLDIQGTGRASQQSVKPGVTIKSSTKIKIKLKE